jgi:hypothetical protein
MPLVNVALVASLGSLPRLCCVARSVQVRSLPVECNRCGVKSRGQVVVIQTPASLAPLGNRKEVGIGNKSSVSIWTKAAYRKIENHLDGLVKPLRGKRSRQRYC